MIKLLASDGESFWREASGTRGDGRACGSDMMSHIMFNGLLLLHGCVTAGNSVRIASYSF